MEAVLRALYKLQKIDLELDDLDADSGDLPSELEAHNKRAKELIASIEEKETALSALRKQRSDAKVEIQEIQDRARDLNERLRAVRNNKEYDATTGEIESAEQRLQELQGGMRSLDDDEADLMKSIQVLETSRDEIQKDITEKTETLTSLQETNADEIKELRSAKEEVLQDIPAELLDRYKHIRTAFGDAVVKVRKDACAGCFRAITPQTLVEMRKNERLFDCEHCGRLLIPEEIAETVSVI